MKEQHVILTEAVVDYGTENSFPSRLLCIRNIIQALALKNILAEGNSLESRFTSASTGSSQLYPKNV